MVVATSPYPRRPTSEASGFNPWWVFLVVATEIFWQNAGRPDGFNPWWVFLVVATSLKSFSST